MFNLSIPKVVVANNKKMSRVLFAIDICNGMCMHPENVLRVPRNYPNDQYSRTSSDCFSAAFFPLICLKRVKIFLFEAIY